MKEKAWRLGKYEVMEVGTWGDGKIRFDWQTYSRGAEDGTVDLGRSDINEEGDILVMFYKDFDFQPPGTSCEGFNEHLSLLPIWDKTKYYIDPFKEPRRKRLIPK